MNIADVIQHLEILLGRAEVQASVAAIDGQPLVVEEAQRDHAALDYALTVLRSQPNRVQRWKFAQRKILLDLAHWAEGHFHLRAQPKIDNATEAEIFYAQILKRLSDLADTD